MKKYALTTDKLPLWDREALGLDKEAKAYVSNNMYQRWLSRAEAIGKSLKEPPIPKKTLADNLIVVAEDSIISDLELDEITSEVGEASNLDLIREDLKQDNQYLTVIVPGDGVADLEEWLFNH